MLNKTSISLDDNVVSLCQTILIRAFDVVFPSILAARDKVEKGRVYAAATVGNVIVVSTRRGWAGIIMDGELQDKIFDIYNESWRENIRITRYCVFKYYSIIEGK